MEPLKNCHTFFQSRGIPKEFVSVDVEQYIEDYVAFADTKDLVFPQFFVDLQESTCILYGMRNAKKPDGFILQGRNGSGKTGWAAALVREALLAGINSLIITMPNLITEYFRDKGLCRDYADMDILVIDEIGKETQKNVSYDILERLLLRRHADGKPTILISNASIDALIGIYGATVQSRFNLFSPIFFPDVDMRKDYNINSRHINTTINNGQIEFELQEVE